MSVLVARGASPIGAGGKTDLANVVAMLAWTN